MTGRGVVGAGTCRTIITCSGEGEPRQGARVESQVGMPTNVMPRSFWHWHCYAPHALFWRGDGNACISPACLLFPSNSNLFGCARLCGPHKPWQRCFQFNLDELTECKFTFYQYIYYYIPLEIPFMSALLEGIGLHVLSYCYFSLFFEWWPTIYLHYVLLC